MIDSCLAHVRQFLSRANEMPARSLARAAARAAAAFAVTAALAAPVLASVGINKSFSPNSVTAGQVSVVTIVLLNPNALPATGVSVTDALPANVVVANPVTTPTNTCGFTITAAAGSGTIALSGGTIPGITAGVAGQCQMSINVVSSLPNTYLNLIPPSAVTSSQGTNAQAAQATLVVSAPANVTGSKVFVPANVHGNGASQTSVSTLTITLTNPNSVALTNAAITDSLPAAVTIATPSSAATTCGPGVATASAPAANPATIALTGGTIPANGSCTITVQVIARNPNAAASGNVANTIPANALTTTQGSTNAAAIAANINVQTGAAITKAFSPPTVPLGGASTLTITVSNFNQTGLANITFTDTWTAANMSVAAAPSTTCGGVLTNTLNSVTLTGGSLGAAPAGVGATTCTITVPVTGNVTTTNSIAAGNFAGVAYTGTGNVVLTVSNITGSKSFATPITQTGTTVMTITLANNTPVASTITSFTDNIGTSMGAGFSVPAGSTVGGTCGSSLITPLPATSLTFNGGTIPANGSCTITVNAVAIAASAAAGNHTNSIAANNVVTSTGTNRAAITGVANVVRGISVSKAFAPATVQTGARTRLTVTVTRTAGATALGSIAFTDSLTTMGGLGFTIANPANETTTCTGGSVIALPGANSFSLSGASLAAGAGGAATSCTVAVDVQTPAGQTPGTFTNRIVAGAVTTAEGVTNAEGTGNLIVSAPTSVTINKSFNPTTVAVNGTSLLTVQIRNNNVGAIALSGVSLADALPPGMFVANPPAPPATSNCGAPTVSAVNGASSATLNNATIAANAICTYSFTVRGTAAGNLINIIPPSSVVSAQGVTNPLLASATLAATGVVNLNVTKTNGQSSLIPGGTTTYTIAVTNAGPNSVAGVTVTDNPPAGVTFGAWTCIATGGAVCGSGSGPILDSVTIPNGGSITYTVPASIAINAPGPVVNTVNLGVPGSVINNGNSSASDTDPLAPLLDKTIVPNTIGVGGASAITLTLANNNNVPISLTAPLSDTMPAGVTTTTANTGSCGGVSVTATTITMASGSAIPSGGCTIVVGITSSTVGSVTNTTSALQATTGTAPAASAPLTVTAVTPTLGKSIAPASIGVGGSATLTLTLGNPNAAAITLTGSFVDNMPTGVSTTTPNMGTCAGVSVTAGSITLASGSSIQAGGCTIVVNVASTTPGGVLNTTGTLDTTAGSAPAASAPLTVTIAGPSLAKAIAPGTIALGGSATLTLTLGNPNGIGIQLASAFTDTMPAGVTITGGNTGTCAGVTTNATSITVASGTVLAPGSCTIVVPVTSSTPGTVTNTTGTLSTNAGSTGPATADLTVTASAPTLGKTIVPGTIAVGGTSTLTLTLGNPNATAIALTAAFTDTMPAGVTTSGGAGGTCSGVSVLPGSITVASGTSIPAGGCTVIVTIASSTPGTVTNTTGTLTTNAGAASPAQADLSVNAPPTLAKTINPATIAIGAASTLTLTLGNPNPGAITLTAALTDTMPAGVTITGANTGTCLGVTTNATSITVASGTSLAPGICTIVVPITSSTPGGVTNTTGTLSTTAGSAPAASAPLTVTAVAPTLGKSIAPSPIAVGGTTTLTLTLGNPNAVAITLSAIFTDPLPSGVTTVGSVGGTCPGASVAPTSVSIAAGTSVPAGGCTVVVTLTSNTPGTVTNTTGTLQTNAGNAGPASADLTVFALPTLAKGIAPATIAIGGTANLTLTLGNANPTPITLTAPLSDSMPAGVTISGANTGTCLGVSTTATSITVASGTAIAPGSCTIVVPVTSNTPGTVTNTTGALDTSAGSAPPASAPLTVTAVASTLSKTILPSTIVSGGTATLTITLANTNAVPITLNAPFTDAMPGGVTIGGSNTGTCLGVTTSPALITVASGATIAVGGCTIVVAVTSNTPGTVTNTTGSLDTNAGTAPPASAPLTVTAANSTVAKAIAPASIPIGTGASLTITLSNLNTTALTLTAPFTDAMPAGVTITGANTGTCLGVSQNATSITMASGSAIPPGGCTIVVPIASSTPGPVTNTTSGLSTNAGTAPSASAPLTVTVVPPALAKVIAPATIPSGGGATLTIALGNANAAALTLTAPFTDTMPAGVRTTVINFGTCTGIVVTSTTITMPAGSTIPVGGCTIVVTITSSTPGTVTNTTGTLTTNGGTAPPASAPLTITAAGAGLGKAIAPATVAAGGTATLTLTLQNTNATALTLTAAFTDPMPAGVTTTSGNTGTCAGVAVSPTSVSLASGATIPPGGCTIVVTITSSTPGTVTNTTSSLATSGGTAPAASAPLRVTAIAPTLAKTIAPATIAPGGAATLTIDLGNPGATPLTLTAAFVDTMPAGVTTTSGNLGTCSGVTVTPTTVTMANASTIPAGGCTIVVTITSSTIGTVTNTTGSLATGGGTAPPASATLTVTGSGSTLGKTIAPSTIAPGGTATLTLALGNAGASPLTLTAAFVDTMPAGVTTTSGNTGTCPGVSVTSTTIAMAAGSSIPPGGCTIVVTITSSTLGTVTNTTGALTTGGGTAPPASAPLTVTGSGPTLAKAIAPSTIASGGTATLTLTLGNAGATPLTLTAAFVDTMPAGVTTTSGNSGTCSGVSVTSTTITMAAGSTIPPGGCTVVVTITSSTPGTVTNTTGPLATNGGTAAAASAPITITGGGVATLTKTIAPAQIPAGGTATLTIALGNAGGVPLVLTQPFTDPMPVGMTVASGNTGTCAGVIVTPTLITLPTGSSIPSGGCTIVVTVTSENFGTATNVTSALVAGSVTAPAASAPLRVDGPVGPVEPIPATSPEGLALLLLGLSAVAVYCLRRRRCVVRHR